MKKFISHFVSFFLVAVMIVSSNITAFAANEKPVDSRFLPEITYTEDNTSTTRVPNLIPITVNPYYNKLVVHVGNLGVDSIDSVTWKETQAKSNVFSILLAFQTLSSRQLNNRGFSLIILIGKNVLTYKRYGYKNYLYSIFLVTISSIFTYSSPFTIPITDSPTFSDFAAASSREVPFTP